MNNDKAPRHGVVSFTVEVKAPREKVYQAWSGLEHRRQWFMGPGWTEIRRSLDLSPGGIEVAHGRFENGMETLYGARFHLVEENVRLVYAFDMQVNGQLFSVSLACVDFKSANQLTEVTYTEQGFFLAGSYDAESRVTGTKSLLSQFSTYVESLN